MASHKAKELAINGEIYDFEPDKATQSSDGLMSKEDKTKIDDLVAITSAEISAIFADF